MTVDADVANMALAKLGTRATITSLDEASTEARAIKTWYSTIRDDVLRGMDWNFNRVYAALASSGTPPARWAYSYAMPEDCLQFWRIDLGGYVPNQPRVPYEIATDGTNRLIYCNVDQATGVYGQRVEDPNRFEPEFLTAFVSALAAVVAFPITQNKDLAALLMRESQMLIEQAAVQSANEQITTEPDRLPESISVRGYDWAPYWLPNGRFIL